MTEVLLASQALRESAGALGLDHFRSEPVSIHQSGMTFGGRDFDDDDDNDDN